MGTVNKVNDVAGGSISKVKDVARASMSKISDVAMAASHTDLWVLVGQSGKVGTSADGSSWTVYDLGSVDHWSIVYNKDSGGDDLWGITRNNNTVEFLTSADPADSDGWTDHGLEGSFTARGLAVDRATNKWWFATKSTSGNKIMFTGSQDADSFGSFDYSSVSSNYGINYGIAASATGSVVMLGIRDDLIVTSSAGLAAKVNLPGNGNNINKGVAYGNGKFFVLAGSGQALVSIDDGVNFTDVSSDITGADTTALNAIAYDGGANGTGTWVIVGNTAFMARSTDHGVNWTEIDHSGTHTRKLQHIATNGSGTWVAVGDEGRIGTSTDHGATWSWSSETTGIDYKHVAINWLLPLPGTNQR
jgi:photosystem II stability/assembly factor-like uncharacterized protein